MRIVLLVLMYAGSACAVPWPILSEPRIIRCESGEQPYEVCVKNVFYGAAGVQFVDVQPVVPPKGNATRLYAKGVHCNTGNALTGVFPFEHCVWGVLNNSHSPDVIGKCELASSTDWELTPDSTCAIRTQWGEHSGAGPGGECVVFTTDQYSTSNPVRTPWGDLTATQVANSGNRFCSKPLPPNVTCNISVPTVIDHGVVRPGETSKREDDGVMDCGSAPKVDVLVNGDTNKNGVKISAVPSVLSPTQLRITTEVVVGTVASAGSYSASYVFVASPY